MKTIAIMNYKGGVGKTVTTINFAAELAAAGKRVIVMDADGQCNLSDIFRADTLHGGTTYEVLTGETGCCWDELVQDTPVEGVKIVPASAELPKADIAALTGERLAKNGIRDFCLAVAEDEGADYILIDCPTAYNAATVAALGAADEIIIPVELEGFSLHGAGEIRSQVANMRTVNPRLRIAGALITKRRGTRIQEAAEQALRVSGIPAFEAAIPLRASVPASMSNLNASKTLRGYAPKDAATKAYLTKADLKAIGKLRNSDKERVFKIRYDAGNPNIGTIEDGGTVIPYTILPDLTSLSGATQSASAAIQTMLYGDPSNYELGLFGDFTVRVDESIKGEERMLTILGDAMVGGNLIVDKGFVVATLPKSGG